MNHDLVPDLVPQPPASTFTRSWRAGAVLYALALVGLGAWTLAANVPVTRFAVLLAAMSGLLTVVATVRLWRWAAQPRWNSGQQSEIRDALHGDDQRAVAHAVPRGEPPPTHLEGWVQPCAQLQQQLIPSGGFMLLVTASSLLPVAARPRVHVGGCTFSSLARARSLVNLR